MSIHGLTDIELLALSVRDPESRRLIREAISAYLGGAFRSAIVSTWIAVNYDIISKARELASLNDPASKAFVSNLDVAIEINDADPIKWNQLRTIESGLLFNAFEKLQLLAQHEYKDLERLKEDRNLCAHPAFVKEDTIFQPSPELVRTHIVHALKHLLINAPLQGKSSIKQFHADLLSQSFPLDADSIEIFVKSKYINRAKDVMVVNLLKTLLFAPFSHESDQYAGKQHQINLILKAISKAKTSIYEDTTKDYVALKFESITDSNLLKISSLLATDTRIWDWLQEATRIRFKKLLNDAGSECLKQNEAFSTFCIPELSNILIKKFDSFEEDVQIGIVSENPRTEFMKSSIQLYGSSGGWRTAEQRGRALMLPLAPLMTTSDIEAMLDAIKNNIQIYQAHGTPSILEQIFDSCKSLLGDSKIFWQEFVEEMTYNNSGDTELYYSYPSIRKKLESL